MGTLRVRLERLAYRVAYRLISVFRWIAPSIGRPGVKCVLTHGQEVLLVRHTYGGSGIWQLPGGGARKGEDPVEVARREMREELGVEASSWERLPSVDPHLRRLLPRVSCLRGEVADRTLTPDPVEIAEARWFHRGALPARLGSDAALVLAVLAEQGAWAAA
jgi:8-oxo-dGTP pyrophosphatase MutT (NUDIX family)